MALLLEQTSGNGVKTAYHRIASFTPDFDHGTVEVVVRSYAAENYRQTEKAVLATEVRINELVAQLDTLMLDPTDENEEDRIDLSNQLNEIYESRSPISDYFVLEQKITLDIPADFEFSRASLYALLADQQFVGAENS